MLWVGFRYRVGGALNRADSERYRGFLHVLGDRGFGCICVMFSAGVKYGLCARRRFVGASGVGTCFSLDVSRGEEMMGSVRAVLVTMRRTDDLLASLGVGRRGHGRRHVLCDGDVRR